MPACRLSPLFSHPHLPAIHFAPCFLPFSSAHPGARRAMTTAITIPHAPHDPHASHDSQREAQPCTSGPAVTGCHMGRSTTSAGLPACKYVLALLALLGRRDDARRLHLSFAARRRTALHWRSWHSSYSSITHHRCIPCAARHQVAALASSTALSQPMDAVSQAPRMHSRRSVETAHPCRLQETTHHASRTTNHQPPTTNHAPHTTHTARESHKSSKTRPTSPVISEPLPQRLPAVARPPSGSTMPRMCQDPTLHARLSYASSCSWSPLTPSEPRIDLPSICRLGCRELPPPPLPPASLLFSGSPGHCARRVFDVGPLTASDAVRKHPCK